jgi:hypothetical protein
MDPANPVEPHGDDNCCGWAWIQPAVGTRRNSNNKTELRKELVRLVRQRLHDGYQRLKAVLEHRGEVAKVKRVIRTGERRFLCRELRLSNAI